MGALPGVGRVQRQLPRGLEVGRHLGELEGDRLAAGDRLAEGLASMRVVDGEVERLPARPTQVIATEIRLGTRNPPSATSRPSPSSPRRLATGTGARSNTRCEWSVPTTPIDSGIRLFGYPLAVGGDQQSDGAVDAARALEPSEQQQVVGDEAERDQVLLSAEVVGIALTHDRAPDVRAGTGVGLCQRERDLDVGRDLRLHEALELLLVGIGQHRSPEPVGDVHDHAQRGVGSGRTARSAPGTERTGARARRAIGVPPGAGTRAPAARPRAQPERVFSSSIRSVQCSPRPST